MSWKSEKIDELMRSGYTREEAEKLVREEEKRGQDLKEKAEWVSLETDGYEG